MKVAIVGSGISGLSLSYLLKECESVSSCACESEVNVTILECGNHTGYDSDNMQIGSKWVGAPPRVFFFPYYANLMNLLAHAGVGMEPMAWSATFSSLNEAKGKNKNSMHVKAAYTTIFGKRVPKFEWDILWTPQKIRLFYDYFCFVRASRQLATSSSYSEVSLREYLTSHKYSDVFVYGFLLPLAAMICTCPFKNVLDYPADVFFRYFAVRGQSAMCIPRDGPGDIAKRLGRSVDRTLLNVQVTQVLPATTTTSSSSTSSKVRIRYSQVTGDNDGDVDVDGVEREEEFDHVVLATQPSVIPKLLRHASAKDDRFQQHVNVFSQVKYVATGGTAHTDESFMPTNKEMWSELNCISAPDQSDAMATLWVTEMAHQSVLKTPTPTDSATATTPPPPKHKNIFQTLNPIKEIDPDKILFSRSYERPVMTTDSLALTQSIQDLQGIGNVWFVGAYIPYAIPLQESCVESAIYVAEKLGTHVAWKEKRWYECGETKTTTSTDCESTGSILISKKAAAGINSSSVMTIRFETLLVASFAIVFLCVRNSNLLESFFFA